MKPENKCNHNKLNKLFWQLNFDITLALAWLERIGGESLHFSFPIFTPLLRYVFLWLRAGVPAPAPVSAQGACVWGELGPEEEALAAAACFL